MRFYDQFDLFCFELAILCIVQKIKPFVGIRESVFYQLMDTTVFFLRFAFSFLISPKLKTLNGVREAVSFKNLI